MAIIIQGYKIETNNPIDVENAIQEIKTVVTTRANDAYHDQLSREIEEIVDDIALNIRPRPDDISILDLARGILTQKINYATANQLPTEYNYYVSLNAFFDGNNTYLKFNSNNNIYRKQLSKIKGLEPYYLDEKDVGTGIEQEVVWNNLMKRYKDIYPLSTQIFPTEDFTVNTKALHFRGPAARAGVIARHNLTNRYLNMIASGKEIPNYLLMRYMDQALEMLTTQKGKDDLAALKEELVAKALLPNITVALVSNMPKKNTEICEEKVEENTEKSENKD